MPTAKSLAGTGGEKLWIGGGFGFPESLIREAWPRP
jgi:hypothetical protein